MKTIIHWRDAIRNAWPDKPKIDAAIEKLVSGSQHSLVHAEAAYCVAIKAIKEME